MIRYDRHVRLLAVGLSCLAGFVDALGYLSLGGYFVSFMSGNTTRLGIGLAQGLPGAAVAGAMIAAFLLGVMTGTLVGRAPQHRASRILLLVAILLSLGALLGRMGASFAAAMTMAAAMGAENAVFEKEGEVQVGVTYMTGTLVKFAQHLAHALTGGPRFGWQPYLLLWLGLATGAVAGALVWPLLGLSALWLAAAAAAAWAGVAARLDFRR